MLELEVEYRVSEGGNSGIGLRGRYEVQIADDFGSDASIHGNGAVYSRITPEAVATTDRQVIEGLTAMVRDANESKPGPAFLQGDHGPIEFRRIVVTPLLPA